MTTIIAFLWNPPGNFTTQNANRKQLCGSRTSQTGEDDIHLGTLARHGPMTLGSRHAASTVFNGKSPPSFHTIMDQKTPI